MHAIKVEEHDIEMKLEWETVGDSEGAALTSAATTSLKPKDEQGNNTSSLSTLTRNGSVAGAEDLAHDNSNDRKPTPLRVFDGVVVPTLNLVAQRKAAENQMKVKLDKYKNSIHEVKIKDETQLSVRSVMYRLDAIGTDPYPVEVDDRLKGHLFERQFLSKTYGGNPQDTFPQPGKSWSGKYRVDNFMFLNLDWNPNCPQEPGTPGLFYGLDDHGCYRDDTDSHSSNDSDDKDVKMKDEEKSEQDSETDRGNNRGTKKLFVRISSCAWQYLGTYQIIPSESLTREEFLSQGQKVKKTWAKNIRTKLWARDVRGRIALRRSIHHNPTRKELDDYLAQQKDSDLQKFATDDRVIGAFQRGEEHFAVWCLKCVGYDTDWITQAAELHANWVKPEPKSKKGGTKQATKPKNNRKNNRKRRAPAADSDEESSDTGRGEKPMPVDVDDSEYESEDIQVDDKVFASEPESEDDPVVNIESPDGALEYVSKGTASRPILL